MSFGCNRKLSAAPVHDLVAWCCVGSRWWMPAPGANMPSATTRPSTNKPFDAVCSCSCGWVCVVCVHFSITRKCQLALVATKSSSIVPTSNGPIKSCNDTQQNCNFVQLYLPEIETITITALWYCQ